MKKIKEIVLEVEVSCDFHLNTWYWCIDGLEPITDHFFLACRKQYKSLKSCKRNWERFAELNGIKNWEYV